MTSLTKRKVTTEAIERFKKAYPEYANESNEDIALFIIYSREQKEKADNLIRRLTNESKM